MYGSSCTWRKVDQQTSLAKTPQVTDLERDKPHALDCVGNYEQVLDSPQGRHVHADVEEGYTDQAFVEVERTHEDLHSIRLEYPLYACVKTPHLLAHRRDQISIHATQERDGALRVVAT